MRAGSGHAFMSSEVGNMSGELHDTVTFILGGNVDYSQGMEAVWSCCQLVKVEKKNTSPNGSRTLIIKLASSRCDVSQAPALILLFLLKQFTFYV
jgi:hypothetical protein